MKNFTKIVKDHFILLYKKQLVKSFSIFMFVCFFIPISYSQSHNHNRDVKDFIFGTWNTNGARWNDVRNLMVNGQFDVLAIQEAGALPTSSRNEGSVTESHDYNSIVNEAQRLCYIGEMNQNDVLFGTVREYSWQTSRGESFYLYYYDRRDHYVMSNGNQYPRVNTAIITRQRADNIFFTAPIYTNQRRTNINRPIIGIRLENAVFFNVHAAPDRGGRNEAGSAVNIIRDYMAMNSPNHTWAMIGDFNRIPSELNSEILSSTPPMQTFIENVHTGESTHESPNPSSSRELDYGVLGGSASHSDHHVSAIIALYLLQLSMNPSDHKPVKFN